jgi:F-type H+-transporting ATPase subunit gamma
MSKRAKLKQHLQMLDEISDIMAAMKNLAFIEITKISKFIATQTRVTETIKKVGSDFFNYHPDYLAHMQFHRPLIYLLIGSERGFCAGFNDNLLKKIPPFQPDKTNATPKLIVVGRKLAAKMAGDNRVVKVVDGPNSVEEIPDVILRLIQSVEQLSSAIDTKPHPDNWLIIYNDESKNHMQVNALQPFVEFSGNENREYLLPPILNVSINEFFFSYSENYLISLLYTTFYASFLSENNQRLHHLDSALDRLEKQKQTLTHSINLVRQEEITEEIEVIMLSAEEILKEVKIEEDYNDA